ncbi:hypothetical protein ACFQI3_02595 [Hansschlegelia quercus]|uniref:hypothetical protein n=1 Tax=Hansschlegelia quercus TaxID=2528245 RepID=UPI00197A82D5|nr:hypothetical protein [Hansschlegelia quercus]
MSDRSVLETFAARLGARGADFSRWSPEHAAEARALLVRSAEARALEAQTRALDDLIARAATADVPNGLAFRIVADVASRRSERFEWLLGSPRRFGLAGASFGAAAVAAGVLIGAFATPQTSDYASAGVDFGPALVVAVADEDI